MGRALDVAVLLEARAASFGSGFLCAADVWRFCVCYDEGVVLELQLGEIGQVRQLGTA